MLGFSTKGRCCSGWSGRVSSSILVRCRIWFAPACHWRRGQGAWGSTSGVAACSSNTHTD